MAVKMHRKSAGCGVAKLCRYLVADALALMHGNPLGRAPVAGDLMHFFFLGRGGGHHVVNKKHKALGAGDLLHAKLFLGLAEKDVRVARKVVGDHEIGPGQNLITGFDAAATGHAGQNFFGHRLRHVTPKSTMW